MGVQDTVCIIHFFVVLLGVEHNTNIFGHLKVINCGSTDKDGQLLVKLPLLLLRKFVRQFCDRGAGMIAAHGVLWQRLHSRVKSMPFGKRCHPLIVRRCSEPCGLQLATYHHEFDTLGVGAPSRLELLLQNGTVLMVKIARSNFFGWRIDITRFDANCPKFPLFFPDFYYLHFGCHAAQWVKVHVIYTIEP